jgi:hypothetical protein
MLEATDWDLAIVDEADKISAHYLGSESKRQSLQARSPCRVPHPPLLTDGSHAHMPVLRRTPTPSLPCSTQTGPRADRHALGDNAKLVLGPEAPPAWSGGWIVMATEVYHWSDVERQEDK